MLKIYKSKLFKLSRSYKISKYKRNLNSVVSL